MENQAELRRLAREAFEEMKTAELAMDDLDIILETPLFKKAMAACERWHRLEAETERRKR
jgi:hypothetical protein